MVQVTCVWCGEIFEAQRRSKRFCSRRCRLQWGREHAKECLGCARTFTPARATQVYCSASCRERAERRRRYAALKARRGEAVRAYSRQRAGAGRQPQRCPVCARTFTPARATQVYCSAACRRARANAARTRAAALTPTARACALIARMHVPDPEGQCAECAHPWPCETRRLAEMTERAQHGGEGS